MATGLTNMTGTKTSTESGTMRTAHTKTTTIQQTDGIKVIRRGKMACQGTRQLKKTWICLEGKSNLAYGTAESQDTVNND